MGEGEIIDRKTLGRLEEWGGKELPRKMIRLFLQHAPERLDQIREGLASGTARSAEVGAHSLKSSAGNVGAHRLQDVAREAEELGSREDLDGLRARLPEIEEAFEEAIEALERIEEELGE